MLRRELPVDWAPGKYWAVPAYLDYVQPALTPAAIVEAEAQLGVRLPAAYLSLLHHQNGGYVRGAHGVSDRVYGIGPRYPSLTADDAWWRPKNAQPGRWAPEGADLLVPFDGDGHWSMCFDYRAVGAGGEPAVTFVDGECRREEVVAPDFVRYLAGLVDSGTAEALRIHGEVGPEEVARALARHFGAAEPTVDTLSYGYPTWRVALPQAKFEWCWCAPNRVPAGFRRDGQRVLVTAETALRLPDDPGCAVLVSATEASRPAVAAAVAELGLIAR